MIHSDPTQTQLKIKKELNVNVFLVQVLCQAQQHLHILTLNVIVDYLKSQLVVEHSIIMPF